ncbi:MAG: hypothetical protein JEZ00_07650 [Anaerolineaceae bacterium]|nr:hypothetical protein [Anaerolineaceae bacterium]
MNPLSDADMTTDDKYEPEKFPQPRTYPNGRNMETAVNEWTSKMEAQAKAKQEAPLDWDPEKFPKPNTYPNGWDISSIFVDPDVRK